LEPFFLFLRMLPFIFDAVGLLPHHILGQGDQPRVAPRTSKTPQHECSRHQKRQKLTQSSGSKTEWTHLRADDLMPQVNWARAGMLIYPESKDPSDTGIDLHVCQLSREGVVGVAGPCIPPHCHLLLLELANTVANEGMVEVRAHQRITEQTLEVVAHRL
jgi:hypothetical protein